MSATLFLRCFRYEFLFSLILFGLFATLRLGAANTLATAQCGICYANLETGERLLVPLESTEVLLDVKPGLLEAEVIQTFTNRTSTALETIYLYPLPDGATLTDFELRFKDRVIRSSVHEKNAAKAIYETAKTEGKKTALLEQHDPSLFSTSVANFLPGETVHVVIRFIQPLMLTAEQINLRFPMVTGDKYFPADSVPGVSGNAALNPPRISGERLSAKHYYAFDIQVAGIPAQSIFSESHQINVQNLGVDLHRVSLVNEITVPDRDFLLQINTRQSAKLIPTVVAQHTATGDYSLLTVFPPLRRPDLDKSDTPRDVIFLIDHSGSMTGTRMESAKLGLSHSLAMLKPADRFRIVIFDDKYESFYSEWSNANSASLNGAQKYCQTIQAAGGTEVQKALGPCLDLFEKNNREQLLVFLTDGDVGNEDSLLNLVESKIGRARLFAFGVGDAPNAPLITKMATLGHGQARFIKDDNAVDQELADFFATINAPVLSNLQLSLLDDQGQPIDATFFPAKVSDVFLGRPLQATCRSTGRTAVALRIEGLEENVPVTIRVPLEAAPLRGEGIEKHFGRMWYEALAAEWRRAPTEETKTPLHAQMLDTALLFELVTELTSRVAVEERLSRDPNTPLVSQKVGQMQPADQVNAAGTLVLSPFVVDAEEDEGYTAKDTLAGSRIRCGRQDSVGGISVVTKQFLDDLGQTKMEDLLNYTGQPDQNPAMVRAGENTGLLDWLPIATVIDPATIDRVDTRTNGTALSTISQRRASYRLTNKLTVRAGDEGFVAATAESSFNLGSGKKFPVLALVSWQKFKNPQSSVLLSTRKDIGEDQWLATLQARQLEGYGQMKLVQTSFQHKFNDSLWLYTTVAKHELNRTNALQFQRSSPTAQFDNLGFFNLDLLTAETRRLQDTVAHVQLTGDFRTAATSQTVTLQGSYHRQKSDWLDSVAAPSRENLGLDFTWNVRSSNDRLSFQTNLGSTQHRTPGETEPQQTTHKAATRFAWEFAKNIHVFANGSTEEILPWVPTGLIQMSSGLPQALSQTIEHREGGQVGIDLSSLDDRLSVKLALFHEGIKDHAFRDWAWERDHSSSGLVLLPGGIIRQPLSYDRSGDWQREGWMGEINLQPTRALNCRANWYCDWKNNGPYRGGSRQASIVANYTFLEGVMQGFVTGFAINARNTMVFNDGYKLTGGVRCDLLFAYEHKLSGGQRMKVQLNLMNLTDCPWQPTRFAKDHGRQMLLSVSREF